MNPTEEEPGYHGGREPASPFGECTEDVPAEERLLADGAITVVSSALNVSNTAVSLVPSASRSLVSSLVTLSADTQTALKIRKR